jgi:S-DNA-T family DNA segregation ATPase FtsK/SpoIIIE
MKRARGLHRPWWQRFLIFFITRVLIIVIIAGLIFWQWHNITTWLNRTTTSFIQTFGWGLVIVVLTVLTLVEIILNKPVLLARYWNKVIGGLAFAALIWGILGFLPGSGKLAGYSQGGLIGLNIIGSPEASGILILVVLAIFALFMLVPRGFVRAIYNFFSWIAGRFRKKPAADVPVPTPTTTRVTPLNANAENIPASYPKYKSEPKANPVRPGSASGHSTGNWLWNRLRSKPEAPGASPVINGGNVEKPVDQTGKPEAVSESKGSAAESKKEGSAEGKTSESQKDMKQAAQEVWKKYGETASQVTADGWKLPPLEILDNAPEVEFSQADNLKKAKLIEDALASYGVEGKVVQINVGPTVTQFGLEPGWDRKLKEVKEKDKNGDVRIKVEEVAKTRVKVDRITSLSNDLSLALAAPSIRIEAPVPGKSIVGIEVPNTIIGTVSLRSVVESNVFQKMQAKAKLAMALGKGAGGESVVGDMTKMPHLLIAGATGSGKTVCIHSIICCFLLHNTPSDVRFIMIDPKRVELTSYNSLPHLATPVIVDTTKALAALRWLSQEMDKRYQIMAAARARNIEAYNKTRLNERLPYLVLVIDELADLMMTAGDEVEHTLCRLAQLARATGIHLIVATQRPSVDVVTGLIKANFPSRISFAVTSQVDSRTILDGAGAEKLLGRGDMLYMPTEAAKAKRLQGCFVSDPETERLVYFWNNQKKETAAQLKLDDIVAAEVTRAERIPDDPLLEEARKLVEQHEHVSTSFLQRHLRIGYPRAARLMEQLEEEMGAEINDGDEESNTGTPPVR